MPCFTAPVRNKQILTNVFVTAFASGGEGGAVAVGEGNAFVAMVDTGATGSCISSRVVRKVGMTSAGKEEAQTAGGVVSVNIYDINLYIPVVMDAAKKGKRTVDLRHFSELRVGEGAFPEHFDVLLGMDVITGGGGLHVSGGSYTFCT